MHTGKLFFLFLNQNICCGYSKELSQWDSSFEHPKRTFKLMGLEINAILGAKTILIWTYVHEHLCKILYVFLCYRPIHPYCWPTLARSLEKNQMMLPTQRESNLGLEYILLWLNHCRRKRPAYKGLFSMYSVEFISNQFTIIALSWYPISLP